MAREILGPLPPFPHLYEFLRIPRGAPGLDWEPLSWGYMEQDLKAPDFLAQAGWEWPGKGWQGGWGVGNTHLGKQKVVLCWEGQGQEGEGIPLPLAAGWEAESRLARLGATAGFILIVPTSSSCREGPVHPGREPTAVSLAGRGLGMWAGEAESVVQEASGICWSCSPPSSHSSGRF